MLNISYFLMFYIETKILYLLMGEKGKGFTRTIIKDTWTITRWGGGNKGGGWEGLGCWAGVGGKSRKLYLNNHKKNFKNKVKGYILVLVFILITTILSPRELKIWIISHES